MNATPNEENITPKEPISGEAEIKSLFGLDMDVPEHEHVHPAIASGHGPHDMPVVEGTYNVVEHGEVTHKPDKHVHPEIHPPVTQHEDMYATYEPEVSERSGMFKSILPYLVVFGLGIFLYYFYFTNFSFSQVFKISANDSKPKSKVAKAVGKLQEERIEDYRRWMGQFYYQVTDDSVIDPNGENCKCGLTNFEKYLLNLNPKVYDTRGNGSADGLMIVQNIDPATGEPLAGNRQKIVEAYFDTDVIADRLGVDDVEPIASSEETVGARVGGADSAGKVAGTTTAIEQKPQISATNTIAVDTTYPAQLEIPAIKVKVPIIFSRSTKDFDHDLTLGAVHYPGTPLPGETGNSYISAHSSALPWVESPYKTVFARFGELKEGDTFNIIMTLDSGKTIRLDYQIKQKGIYDADDQLQFINTAKSAVSLSTCWPIGTAKQRYVVRGELVGIQQ